MDEGLEGLELPLGLGVVWAFKTGSRWTCQPPVLDRDDDRLLLVTDLALAVRLLRADGWKTGGSAPDTGRSGWVSMKRGEVNLILTDSPPFASRFEMATSLAARLNLLTRESRVALFKAILYGK